MLCMLCAGNVADWAAAFDCQVHIPAADRQWVTEPGDHINYWSGMEAVPALTSDTATCFVKLSQAAAAVASWCLLLTTKSCN